MAEHPYEYHPPDRRPSYRMTYAFHPREDLTSNEEKVNAEDIKKIEQQYAGDYCKLIRDGPMNCLITGFGNLEVALRAFAEEMVEVRRQIPGFDFELDDLLPCTVYSPKQKILKAAAEAVCKRERLGEYSG